MFVNASHLISAGKAVARVDPYGGLDNKGRLLDFALKSSTRLGVTYNSYKHSSLFQHRMNDGGKKCNSTGAKPIKLLRP